MVVTTVILDFALAILVTEVVAVAATDQCIAQVATVKHNVQVVIKQLIAQIVILIAQIVTLCHIHIRAEKRAKLVLPVIALTALVAVEQTVAVVKAEIVVTVTVVIVVVVKVVIILIAELVIAPTALVVIKNV